MTSTTFPAFVKQLRSNLRTRLQGTTGLTDVVVYAAPVGPSRPYPLRAVTFRGVETPRIDPEAMPNVMRDSYDVVGVVWAAVPGASTPDDETAADQARDDVASILDVIAAELDADRRQGGTVTNAYLSQVDWDQGVDDQGNRACRADFHITVRART